MLGRVSELESRLRAAELELDDLTQLAARRTAAKDELESLYADAFAGPTPEYPQEDELEDATIALGIQISQVRFPRLVH